MYVVGSSGSSDLPTVNAYQSSLSGTSDAVLIKLNSTGNTLLYSSYLGGTGTETAYDVVLDSSNIVHVVGSTGSTEFANQERLRFDTWEGPPTDSWRNSISAKPAPTRSFIRATSAAAAAATSRAWMWIRRQYLRCRSNQLDRFDDRERLSSEQRWQLRRVRCQVQQRWQHTVVLDLPGWQCTPIMPRPSRSMTAAICTSADAPRAAL